MGGELRPFGATGLAVPLLGLGVVAKRSFANAPWNPAAAHSDDAAAEAYRSR